MARGEVLLMKRSSVRNAVKRGVDPALQKVSCLRRSTLSSEQRSLGVEWGGEC